MWGILTKYFYSITGIVNLSSKNSLLLYSNNVKKIIGKKRRTIMTNWPSSLMNVLWKSLFLVYKLSTDHIFACLLLSGFLFSHSCLQHIHISVIMNVANHIYAINWILVTPEKCTRFVGWHFYVMFTQSNSYQQGHDTIAWILSLLHPFTK